MDIKVQSNCGYEEDMPAWLYGEFADTDFSSSDKALFRMCKMQ